MSYNPVIRGLRASRVFVTRGYAQPRIIRKVIKICKVFVSNSLCMKVSTSEQ